MPKKKNDLSQRLEAVIKTLVPQQEQNPDDLGPMMRAIKAVHSISDHTSTTPEDLERQRAGQELFARLVTPSIGIRNDSLTVGNIPAEWVSLEHGHDRRHAVLYCHGGGYTCGQLGYARILASKLALATGFDVLSFEYRLAPEHPFPAAIEDALAVWDYLMYMGYGARDVIVAGDSAGGNLALELALKPYIRSFAAFSSCKTLFTVVCSYGDDLVLGTASALRSTTILQRFYRSLAKDGLDVTLYATEVEK